MKHTSSIWATAIMLCIVARPALGLDLSLTLALPSSDPHARVDATGPRPHIHLLVGNESAVEQRLWREQNSWGYYAVRFEVTGPGGQVVVIRKKEQAFTRNFPSWWTLQPRESLVLDVYLGDPSVWEAVSVISQHSCGPVALRAVFEVPETAESRRNGVWTGLVASEPRTVSLCR